MPPLPSGKLPPALLTQLLREIPLPAEVVVGPALGEDACAIEVSRGLVIAATDPITLTGSDVGRMAVVVNANDVAVMGVRPRWFLATVLLPVGTGEADVESIFESMRTELDLIGASLVGGHTEITDVVSRPVVVGQMLGLADDGRVVRTSGVRAGDVVVQLGPAPVEGAAVLAAETSADLSGLDPELRSAAARALDDPGISIVDAALGAAACGATALHDPTEGGLAAGLHELAAAAGVALRVDKAAVMWFEPGLAVCRALGADPWGTLASGALLATFGPRDVAAAVESLRAAGHDVAVIGTAEEGAGVSDDFGDSIPWPVRDEVARVLSA